MLENRSSSRRSRVVARRRAVLGQAGMQVDRVRHDGRADDADRERQRAGVRQLRHHRVPAPPRPSRPAR